MENQRIRLSKTLLKNALVHLLQKKPLNKISVLEICETAQINRTTFYMYYGSQTDLLIEIVRYFLAQLEVSLALIPNKSAVASVLANLYEQRTTF
ncbi:MAG: TetR/AcrR family transcriptional regulator [Lancefieldella rimae]